ncbi:MAG: hypothetical protein SD837_12760 [Candidatus Electrothrix scaldis]|nr:MAG: hypothetical protein SD837_12760 [Candidatus Electrothrix sp. GW3-3]
MNNDKYKYYLIDLLSLIKDRAINMKKDGEQSDSQTDSFKSGYLMAIHEVISLARDQADAFGISPDDIGLTGKNNSIKFEDMIL